MVSRAGFSADLSGPVMTRAICHFDNAYWLPDVAIHGYCAARPTRRATRRSAASAGRRARSRSRTSSTRSRASSARTRSTCAALNFYGQAASATSRRTARWSTTTSSTSWSPSSRRRSDYRARRDAIAAFNASSPVLKRGLALTPVKFGISFNVIHFNQAGALVHVYSDGSVLVNHGGTEMGQGLNTKVAQVVAHELGVDFDARARHRHRHAARSPTPRRPRPRPAAT